MDNSQTELEHYFNPEDIGNYQWFTFNEVISKLEQMATDHDSYLNNTRRSQFVNYTRDGIKLLQRSIRKDLKSIEFVIPENFLFPYPQDFVNWVSLSVIYEGALVPILIDKGINTAKKVDVNDSMLVDLFLRSNQEMSLYRAETGTGELEDESETADQTEQKTFIHSGISMSVQGGNYFNYDENGNIIRTDTENQTNEDPFSKMQHKNANQLNTQGLAAFNDLQGRISFGSDMAGFTAVLEYYSDGLFAWSLSEAELKAKNIEPIRIHKDLVEVLIKYVYQEIIGYRRNVPANEKRRARDEYKTYLHKAKLDRLGFNLYTASKMVR